MASRGAFFLVDAFQSAESLCPVETAGERKRAELRGGGDPRRAELKRRRRRRRPRIDITRRPRSERAANLTRSKGWSDNKERARGSPFIALVALQKLTSSSARRGFAQTSFSH